MTYCVELSGVSKAFLPGQNVLDDVHLALPKSVTTAVVGESGSGKTTLLQLVNAVLDPDCGEVRVFGAAIPEDRVHFRRGIGYSVQGAGLFPHMTNRDNVLLLARLENWSETAMQERYVELLGQMGLSEEVSQRYPAELSGGQQQRVGLCRALMLKPNLLLLDEPFSAVDPITRVEIYERFQFVQEHEGVSTLLVTHDMREAVRLASHLVIVNAGRISQSGPTQDVVAAPADEYVARLLRDQL
ncbi:MAG: ATP-binding cassette domain-containing protein [Gammaproteobacteria bacterium]|nr:ATP-binding cassette domain-containing protein [Gammaproteobacteria bacterium]